MAVTMGNFYSRIAASAARRARLDEAERADAVSRSRDPKVLRRQLDAKFGPPPETRLELPSGRVVTGDLAAFRRHFPHLEKATSSGREVAVTRHETRSATPVAARATGTAPQAAGSTLTGYAAVFGTDSEVLSDGGGGQFIERIAPGAFRAVLADDVRALVNHDSNLLLGRTKSGTLQLSEDAKGLHFTVTTPATQAGRDVVELVRRGDMTQCSFGFTIGSERWEVRSVDGKPVDVRTITQVKRLYDVSLVVYPAYPATTVQARSKQKVG